jgi:hypothetical protein
MLRPILNEKCRVIGNEWMRTESERIGQMISIHNVRVSHCVEWYRDRSLWYSSNWGRSVENHCWHCWNIHGSDGNVKGLFDDDRSAHDGGNGHCGWTSGNIASDGDGSIGSTAWFMVDAVSDVAIAHVEEDIASAYWSPLS